MTLISGRVSHECEKRNHNTVNTGRTVRLFEFIVTFRESYSDLKHCFGSSMGSSVSTVTKLRSEDQRFKSRQEQEVNLFSKTIRPTVGPTQGTGATSFETSGKHSKTLRQSQKTSTSIDQTSVLYGMRPNTANAVAVGP